MNSLISSILEIWIFLARGLILWLIIALFIPGIIWYDHAYTLVLNLVVYPAGYIFDFFIEYYKSVLATWNPDANPIEDFANILLYLGGIACALGLPVLFFAGWFWCTLIGVLTIIPKPIRAGFSEGWTAETENNWHLLSGRMTIDESFKQEQEANAIASALNKYR